MGSTVKWLRISAATDLKTVREGAALWWLIPLGVLAMLGLAFAAVALFQGWFNR